MAMCVNEEAIYYRTKIIILLLDVGHMYDHKLEVAVFCIFRIRLA